MASLDKKIPVIQNLPQDSVKNTNQHLSINKQLETSLLFAKGGTAASTPDIFSFAIQKHEIMNPDQENENIPENAAPMM